MTDTSTVLRRVGSTAAVVAVALALAACGAKKHDATQAAARVDGNEITVHQINYRLQRERGLRPEQVEAASHKVLDQLIEEQLVVEQADKAKTESDPGAQQALDAARREVLARAYVEQVAQGVPVPTEDALHRYFDDNDALFSHRRVYTMQEFVAQVPADKIPALTESINAGESATDLMTWFKAQGISFRTQQTIHAAEQVPLGSLKQLAAMHDGQALVSSNGTQFHATYVVSSRSEPVSYDRAKGAITQFLLADARRKATESNVSALKTAAKIEYSAPYEALAASQSGFSLKDVNATASSPAPDSGARVSLPTSNASSVQVTLPNATASSTQISLPTSAAPGTRVSLPTTASSSVEVRLPSQTGDNAKSK